MLIMHVAQASIPLVQFEPNNRANGMWIMSSNLTLNTVLSPSTVYQIRIKGHLDGRWRGWFEGLTITLEDDGDTLLTGSVVASSPEEALNLLSSGEIDIETHAILESGSPTQSRGGETGQILELVESGPNSLSIKVDMENDGWLVLAETWYPGWKARLDGSLVEIHRANYLFRGISVPEGRHTIEFFYQPRSFWMGSLISVTGMVILFLFGYLR